MGRQDCADRLVMFSNKREDDVRLQRKIKDMMRLLRIDKHKRK